MVLLGEKGVAAVGIGVGGAAAAADDYGDGMQCPDHPYRPNAGAAGGGGVCAFCLQEKLGKLVSSSSSKYSSFSPLPSSLFYDRGDPDDEDDGSSSTTTPPSAASSRYSSASAANAGVGGGKGKKGSYSLFGGRRRRQGATEGAGQERRKPGSDAIAAAAGKHSSRMMMIPFFHASTRSSGHASKNPQKPTNPPTVPPVYTNRNGIAPSTTTTTTVSAVSTNGGSGGGGNGLSVFTRSRSVTARPIVPEGVPMPMVVQTSTSSSTTPRLRGDLVAADSPRRRRFWSFLHLSSSQPPRPSTSSHRNPQAATRDGLAGEAAAAPTLPPKHHQTQPSPSPPAPAPALTVTIGGGGSSKPPSVHPDPIPASAGIGSTRSPATAAMGAPSPWNDDADQAAGDTSPSGSQASVASVSPFGRKVERSRSVGCGSRSFSGDFLERISTGLGDCALRRVESHREPAGGVVGAGKLGNKIVLHRLSISTAAAAVDDDDDDDEGGCRRRRSARCAGIFGGMIPSSFYSTSSSTAASSYWPPPHDEFGKVSCGGTNSNSNSNRGTPRAKGSWGWAFASPMRAFRTSSATTNVNASGFKQHQVFHGADGAAARRSTSVAGAVGFGAGGGAPSYPYLNGGC